MLTAAIKPAKKGKLLVILAVWVLLAIVLQACGQKGDLILPDQDAAKAEQEKKQKERDY